MRVADRAFPTVDLADAGAIADWPIRPIIAVAQTAGGWRDAACEFSGFEFTVGPPDDRRLYPAGELTLELSNVDGSWARWNVDGSPADQGPGSIVAVGATDGVDVWWICHVAVARWDQLADDRVVVSGFDVTADLAQPVGTFTAGAAGDKPDARIGAILTAAGRTDIRRRLDVGIVALTAQPTERPPLEEAQVAAGSDGGVLFVDQDGTVVYTDREWRAGRDDQPVVWHLSDNVCDLDGVVWDPTISTNDDAVADRVVLENVAGIRSTAGAGVYVYTEIGQQWTTKAEGDALATHLAARGSTARRLALDQFDLYLFDPNQPDLWRIVDTRVGDLLRFTHDQRATDGVARVDLGLVVDWLTHSVTAAGGWRMTVGTTPATAFYVDVRWDSALWDDPSAVWGP